MFLISIYIRDNHEESETSQMKYIIEKKRLIFIGIISVIHSSIMVSFSLLMSELVNSIIGSNLKQFKLFVVLTIGFLLLQILSQINLAMIKNNYIKLNMKELKYKLSKKIFSYKYSDYNKKEVSDYISFFNNDINLLEENYYTQLVELISKAAQLILACIAICLINPLFLIIIIITMIISGVIPLLFSRKLSILNDDCLNKMEKTNGKLQNYFEGFSIIKSFNLIDNVTEDIRNSFNKVEDEKCKRKNVTEIIGTSLMCMTILLTLLTFILGGQLIFLNKLNIGILIALVQLLGYVIEPIVGIVSSISLIKSMDSIVKHCDEIMNYDDLNCIINNKLDIDYNNIQTIELKDVSFAYNNNETNGINKVSYKFEMGKKYAIIGPNGSGKSTMLKILAGYYNEYNGEVLINDIEYKNINEKDKSSLISYMEQKVFLFNWSIKDNITLFKDFSNNKYKEVIEELNIRQIADLYKENMVSEKLSGGEKQKIALSRFILKDSPILIADEPTSALDIDSKNTFETLLEKDNGIKIVVTHDLGEKLKNYDKILIMDSGELIKSGTYDELENDIINIVTKDDNVNLVI